jgi:hypothetical protein
MEGEARSAYGQSPAAECFRCSVARSAQRRARCWSRVLIGRVKHFGPWVFMTNSGVVHAFHTSARGGIEDAAAFFSDLV